MQQRLPIELYSPVLEAVGDRHDLCSLARTSRTLQREAERILYREIDITDDEWQLCVLLSQKSHLAHHVRSFVTQSPPPLELNAHIQTALHNMSNLSTLSLSNAAFLPSQPTRFQLVTFECSFCPEKDLLYAFLLDQPTLENVILPPDFDFNHPVTPFLLPKLNKLSGSAALVTRLLPHRHITHLRMVGDLPPTLSDDAVTVFLSNCHPQMSSLFWDEVDNGLSSEIVRRIRHSLPMLKFLGPCAGPETPEKEHELMHELAQFKQLEAVLFKSFDRAVICVGRFQTDILPALCTLHSLRTIAMWFPSCFTDWSHIWTLVDGTWKHKFRVPLNRLWVRV